MRRRSGISGWSSLLVAAMVVAGACWSGPLVAAAPSDTRPAGCVPFGTAQLPPGLPSAGGRVGLSNFSVFTGDAPSRIDLRTPTTQFNRFWEFALVGHELLTRPRQSAEPWRTVPLPDCLRGRPMAISLDDDELLAVDEYGWMYTMDNASQDPLFWNWTSAWGAPVWFGPGRQLPGTTGNGQLGGPAANTWSYSVVSPWDNQTFADVAGRIHHVSPVKATMVPALTGDGSRITYAEPYLPNDDSYEIGGPLGGRFRAIALSAAGSTTFVMNAFGDMYTRIFDFDSTGSNAFLRYSWESQSGKPSAPNMIVEALDRNTAAIQLPAPDWVHQPKVPGEITSAISVHSTGPGPGKRELRVEGRQHGTTGYWHKGLADENWQFTPTGTAELGTPLPNPATDHSADTLAPPIPWNLSTTLPARDGVIDGQLLADVGFFYGILDPRLLDVIGQPAHPAGYRLEVPHFDPAASARTATVIAPDGNRLPVVLNTADGLRFTPRTPGLDADPRHLVGAIEIPADAYDTRASNPALQKFVQDWMRDKRFAPITVSATDHDLVIR